MRRLTLALNEEQFMELYAFSSGFLATNKDESPFADLMQHIHNQCDPRATDSERDYINNSVEKMCEVLEADSPDKYLAKAGLSGLMEQLTDKL